MSTHTCDCGARLTVVPEQSRRSPYEYDAPVAIVCRHCAARWAVVVLPVPAPGVQPKDYLVHFVRDGMDQKHQDFLAHCRTVLGTASAP